ncbi:hypothetical protein QYB58_002140 [Clostridium perfringens]|nr:hypothetical protein [Clostridium perfringens]
MNNIRIYNTKYEIGVRALMIISKYPNGIDMDSLIILEYLSLHVKIIDEKLKSLHPDNPFYGMELLSKRRLMNSSINLLFSKGLIDKKYCDEGVLYTSTILTDYFLSYFDSNYFNKLNTSINTVINKFKGYNRDMLEKYVYENIEIWKG